jgi:hypothetical protein
LSVEKCCLLSGRGLRDGLITRPEESYRLWCVVVCDLDTSRMRRPRPALGRSATAKKKKKETCAFLGTQFMHRMSVLHLFPLLHTPVECCHLCDIQRCKTLQRNLT